MRSRQCRVAGQELKLAIPTLTQMHTCAPPKAALTEWLDDSLTFKPIGHLLLEQRDSCKLDMVKELRPYFESAHLDAREYFHKQLGIDLHPDVASGTTHATYPNCLDTTAVRGLFGEVMAGLMTENYPYIGGHSWTVPIFLFRYHADVEAYLFDLVREPKRQRQIWGRPGTDFLGLSLDNVGNVVRVIAGEAKWRQSLTDSVVDRLLLGDLIADGKGNKVRDGKGIWGQLNRAPKVPHGLRQLQRLLEDRDPNKFAATILSMDNILLVSGGAPPPSRTDLVMIIGNGAASRESGDLLIDHHKVPAEYQAGNDLQVVEVILKGGGKLIDDLYKALWT